MSKASVKSRMRGLGEQARQAYRVLAVALAEQRSEAIKTAASEIRRCRDQILNANYIDVKQGRQTGLSEAMLDRLLLDDDRIDRIASTMDSVAEMPEPVGKVLATWDRPNGLRIERVSVPLGVIGIIYESRPNVTADAAALCIKSGNSCILRSGSDALKSSLAIAKCVQAGLASAGLPAAAAQLVPIRDRAAVGEMLTMTGFIDVIIPRGGKSLTRKVMEESKIPTIQHLDGNCHTYIHSSADLRMACGVLLNAKMRRTGICGATESLLIDKAVVVAMLPDIVESLTQAGCELRGDEFIQTVDPRIKPANEKDWSTEFLDAVLSVKTVAGVEEAVEHINRYGSHHTDAIVAADSNAAQQFLNGVDSAIVLHNASTQFADGGEFGMGAEIGISTGRLHARGPVELSS